jgi:sucrose phosphorylase
MFFRKPGLPILMVRFPDGRDVPYWNTFYQEVQYRRPDTQEIMEVCEGIQYLSAERVAELVNAQLDEGKKPGEIDFGKYVSFKEAVVNHLESGRRYLGQMDLNIKSPLVWEHYENTLKKLSDYGARIVRLDAFAYAPKEPGEKNFLNDPGTWDLLEKVRELADKYDVTLLPENLRACIKEGIYDLRLFPAGTYDLCDRAQRRRSACPLGKGADRKRHQDRKYARLPRRNPASRSEGLPCGR